MKLIIIFFIFVSSCNTLIAQYHRRLPIRAKQHYIGSLQFQRLTQSFNISISQTMEIQNSISQPIHIQEYNKNWLIHKMLGEGATAKVYLVEDLATSEFKVLKKYTEHYNIQKQYSILSTINHPINYSKCPTTSSTLSISPYIESTRNLSNIQLSEREVKILMYKIIFEMNKIHHKGIIHSDIKPSNVIIDVKMRKRKQITQKIDIKIIDWNLAVTYYQGKKFDRFQGTPKYMAPELLVEYEYYTPAVDVWSTGMLMYRVIAGDSLIDSSSRQLRQIIRLFGYEKFMEFYNHLRPQSYIDILTQIQKSTHFTDYNLEKRLKESKLNEEQISLVKKMIVLDPANRPTFEELLRDEYFADIKQFYEPGYYKALKKNQKKNKNQNDD